MLDAMPLHVIINLTTTNLFFLDNSWEDRYCFSRRYYAAYGTRWRSIVIFVSLSPAKALQTINERPSDILAVIGLYKEVFFDTCYILRLYRLAHNFKVVLNPIDSLFVGAHFG